MLLRSTRALIARFTAGRRASPAKAAAPEPARDADPWFWSHYDASAIVLSLVPPACVGPGRTVLDFGCGDGALTLGVASRCAADVVGVDLHRTFLHLPDFARRNLGSAELPRNLSFRQNILGAPLPVADHSIDLVYSWSVFEHLADVEGTLAELARVARPGATLFIQIEPLFFGPHGSHLQRLVAEPWAHLVHDEEAFLGMAARAADTVPESEKDALYRTNSFEDVKRHLLREYRSLNRITADELACRVAAAGFEAGEARRIEAEGVEPPPELLARFPRSQLMTNQVVIVATRR